MGGMIGAVISDNLISFFIFWELTSVTSFFLIGFRHYQEFSRNGARMAFLTTAGTSLFLLAGFILLAQVAGNFTISEVLTISITPENQNYLIASFLLILVGAMGKSAQFPFHYWLPSAMAAPAPVSAYLHSATMVKLGVFVLGKFYILFGQLEIWSYTLSAIGTFTFLFASLMALLNSNVKGILANSTVAQLGFLFAFYGFTGWLKLEHDYLHIINHVFYKASLFMMAGILFEATGAVDLKQTGQNLRRMPLLAFITFVGICTMAGIFGTSGFISKEYALKAMYKLEGMEQGFFLFLIGAFILGSIIKVTFSLRLFFSIFIFKSIDAEAKTFEKPGLGIQLPALFLAICALITGFFPSLLSETFALFVTNVHYNTGYTLKLWHGINSALITSIFILIAGIIVCILGFSTKWKWANQPNFLRFDLAFEVLILRVFDVASKVTEILSSDRPSRYLTIIISTFLTFLTIGIIATGLNVKDFALDASQGIMNYPVFAFTTFLMTTLGISLLFTASMFLRILILSLIGFLSTFIFVIYRAPDLSLTQIMVESASFLLLFFFLARIKKFKNCLDISVIRTNVNWFKSILSIGIGTCISGFLYLAQVQGLDSEVGKFYLENTIPLAKGNNAVNTILVDFRGFDTFIEITVLLVAAVGCTGLLYRIRSNSKGS